MSESGRGLGRGVVYAVVAFGALALLPASLGAQPTDIDPCAAPTADTGFSEVQVNLPAGTINRVLPFDVPIRFCGTLATGAKTVTLQYVADRKNPPQVDDDCRGPGGAPIAWQPANPISGRVNGTTFRAVIPRLESQRFYAFCFRSEAEVTSEVADAFRPVARETLDEGLAPIPRGDLTADESEALRKKLAAALLDQLKSDQAIAPGTLFDSRSPHNDLADRFNGKIRQVLEPQLRRNALLQTYATLQFDLAQTLRGLQSDPAVGRLTASLAAPSDPNLAALSNAFRGALDVMEMSPDATARTAQGLDPTTAEGETLDATFDPATAGEIAGRYDALAKALAGFPDLIQRATGPGGVQLPEGDAAAMAPLVAPQGPAARASALAATLSSIATNVQASLAARASALDLLASDVALRAVGTQIVDASSTGGFETFQNYYVSADAGLVAAPALDAVVSYIGVNLYLRPVNKNAPLRQLGNFRQTFSRRFAFTLGLTVQSLADSDNGNGPTRQDLFGNQSMLIGAGLRITDMIRLGGGALVFKKDDPSPLITKFETAVSYYLTVSFDLNVARAFKGGLGGLFPGN
ncbi:MAG TPA: hypothetical protein VN851_25575 [Thermoanaerobaculia bacterium]|nr:hypothetical protein [Thermoanaerobaculia bacterium]